MINLFNETDEYTFVPKNITEDNKYHYIATGFIEIDGVDEEALVMDDMDKRGNNYVIYLKHNKTQINVKRKL